MIIYHIVYKTIHIDGRYYIGRHSTSNLEDGYLGSGSWVESIKDKATLRREIIDYSAQTIEQLKLLEGKFIDKFFDDLENTSLLKRIYKDLIFKTTGIKIVEFKDKATNSINTIIKEIDRMCKLLTVIK